MYARSLVLLLAFGALACGAEDPPPSPPCEQQCQDNVAVRALREMMKLAYNLTIYTNPVGPQDETTPCPQGGQVRVFGEATANTLQGANIVSLTYTFSSCGHIERDDEARENYDMTLEGEVAQQGTMAVQPTSTTALVIYSASMTMSGTVYDPPLEYRAEACEVLLGQDGNNVSGSLCGRIAGVDM
jgi:hypothetical protein